MMFDLVHPAAPAAGLAAGVGNPVRVIDLFVPAESSAAEEGSRPDPYPKPQSPGVGHL
jgi:hypothetical protein